MAHQNSPSKLMVILSLCDLYGYEIEVIDSTSETSEDIPAEQTYATMHAMVNGVDEIELSETINN